MVTGFRNAEILIESRMCEAASGDADACYELGIAYSSGSGGIDVDMIQAHKWFNLAAVSGNQQAQECRSQVADEMTAREIAEAQRQARAWLGATQLRHAA